MLNNRFKELAAQAWAEHPGIEHEEFLEYFGRKVVDECAKTCDNYLAMNVPGAMLGALMKKQFGVD
jgi:hypothetical protein